MKGATVAVTTFAWYERHLIRSIDKKKKERQAFVIESTKALKLTTRSTITRKRIRRKR